MSEVKKNIVFKNLPNIVSILGVLPLSILFMENGYQYLVPLIIFNNIMDDLDGILAVKLNLKSNFGAILDNLCDAIAHIIFVMTVGVFYGTFCFIGSMIATVAILVRIVSRLKPDAPAGIGSPTNELIRHMLFVLLLAQYYTFNPAWPLVIVFLLNSVSMLIPIRMPYMLRTLAKPAFVVGLINITLIVAWLVPQTTVIISICFFLAYLCSFIAEKVKRVKTLVLSQR